MRVGAVTIGERPYLVEVDEFSADEEGNYEIEGNAARRRGSDQTSASR